MPILQFYWLWIFYSIKFQPSENSKIDKNQNSIPLDMLKWQFRGDQKSLKLISCKIWIAESFWKVAGPLAISESCTVWKMRNFSITQILREIDFVDSSSAKSAFLKHLEALYLDFLWNFWIFWWLKFTQIKNSDPQNWQKRQF